MQGDDFQVIFIHQGEHFQVTFIQLDVTLLMFCSPVKCFTNFFKILGLLAVANESQGPEMPDYLCQVTGPRSKHRLTRFFATISHLSKSRKGNLDILDWVNKSKKPRIIRSKKIHSISQQGCLNCLFGS